MAILQTKRRNIGFPHGTVVKNLPANAGDVGSIPGSGRSIGGGNENPLQYSCLGNPMDRGAWRDPVIGVTKKSTQCILVGKTRLPGETLFERKHDEIEMEHD